MPRTSDQRLLRRLLIAVAATALAAASLVACSDDGGGSSRADADADAGDTGDASDTDAAPDTQPDPDVTADPDTDLGPDADLGDEDMVEPLPMFQLAYAAGPDDLVGITDIMGIHVTNERLYVTGLWEDTARVSYFPRDDLDFPWCLYDGLGWPTGLAEHPGTGEIWVTDMVYGLVVITPPASTGDCGCDAVVTEKCAVESIDLVGATGLGGVAIAEAGRIFVSGLDRDANQRPTIWEVIEDGESVTFEPRATGAAIGDVIGLHLSADGGFLYAAASDGFLTAHRVETDGFGVNGVIQSGTTGFPTDVTTDDGHYYWTLQDPFAHPDNGRGGSVRRSTLDGVTNTPFGEGQLVWPAGVSSDGEDWFVVDRATGIWGFF